MATAANLRPEAPFEISRDELSRRLHDPELLVVNALPREAYDEAHIAGSVSLPLAEVKTKARALIPEREREIAVYCGGPD